MNELHTKIHTMVALMGFSDFRVEVDDNSRKIIIFINLRNGDCLWKSMLIEMVRN